MNGTTRTWTLLFGLLLAVAPAAGADLDLNRHLIPELKVNGSIETIAISGELSLQPEPGVTAEGTFGIPFGSIVVHTADAKTLIFDGDGNHLFSISDERSAKIPTPAGVEKPCTWVSQVPSGSRSYHRGDTTFVFGTAGGPILTVINEGPLIAVSGRVTDAGGNPVPGASVRFEPLLTLDEPLAAVTTDEDGRYQITAPGYRQTVTVEKEGYSTLREELIFENSINTLDLELEPLPRTVPGFGSALAVLSLLGFFLLIGRNGW
ncbi:carboxypeptidase-like regulatory domain-containing protein [Methanoculleus oceani]|uniref:Carboxypeptidase regulatory-like domain-containing protein n=1 Tax=Methanoculleus oceani TaxID=2184756 RepID=A0ABD4TCJ1_9EURY|nr:carboxypeptidase-like regulatory domain-containing protein [Methanoculleus sp. CWC-02]MCM2465174.1 hypothetical protein [Methanoculleus sp. CWC-02]